MSGESLSIEYDVDVAPLTTFGIKAKSACLCRYKGAESLKGLLGNTRLPRPLKFIGQGANLLFVSDFNGTLAIDTLSEIEFRPLANHTVEVRAAAGTDMDTLVDECCRHNLWGLENLSGIPGTVGASAVQNIGAYGVEASDLIVSVECISAEDLTEHKFTPDSLEYGYRTSMFKKNPGRYIITHVSYRLTTRRAPRLEYGNLATKADPATCTPDDIRRAVISLRETKLPTPAFVGSAGSFFVNPVIDKDHYNRLCELEQVELPRYDTDDGRVKVPAAWLIDRCGLKGYRHGGAQVWPKQPLVIANIDNATSGDVLAIEHEIIEKVLNRFDIKLRPEVEHIGANGTLTI